MIQNGRAELTSFVEAVFNPSTLPRFFHTMVGAIITGAFFMGGISAWLVLKQRQAAMAARTLTLAVVVGFFASIVAVFPTGHIHAAQVANTQPEKFAAIEGLYEGSTGAPLVIFAYPETDPPNLRATIEVPGVLSWLAFGDPNAPIRGISDFPEDEVPKGAELWLSFVSFHNMVALGSLFVLLTGIGMFLLWRKKLTEKRWFLKALLWSIPLPILACEFGWIATEVGRQPWIVYGELKTADAASVTVGAGEILFSIIMFGLIYAALGFLWLFLLSKKVKHGPEPLTAVEEVA